MAKPITVAPVKEVKSRVDSYSNGRSKSLGMPSGGILAWVISRSRQFVKFDCFPEDAQSEVSSVLIKASLCDELGYAKAFEKYTGRDRADILSVNELEVFNADGMKIAA